MPEVVCGSESHLLLAEELSYLLSGLCKKAKFILKKPSALIVVPIGAAEEEERL